MDRQAVLDKIAAMLRLQESSNFDGESAAAAALIDKLCAKYGVTIDEATMPQVLTEDHHSTGRLNDAEFRIFCAVASFYDAKGYVYFDRSSGRVNNIFKCIGTDAQQIQVRLYYEFLVQVMNREADVAYNGEKILANLLGRHFDKKGFKLNFKKAFADKIRDRLIEMKQTRDPHEHKEVTAIEVSKMKFGSRKVAGAAGIGAQLGANAGSNASLNKQATGRQTLQLSGV